MQMVVFQRTDFNNNVRKSDRGAFVSIFVLLSLLLLSLLHLPTVHCNQLDRFALDYEHGSTRADRFPTVEERVQIYMSNWYITPCNNKEEGNDDSNKLVARYAYEYDKSNANFSDWPLLTVSEPTFLENSTTLVIDSIIEPDKVFLLDRDTVTYCSLLASQRNLNNKHASRILFQINMRMYCDDVATTFLTALDHVLDEKQVETSIPMLLQFGDLKHSHVYRDLRIPHFKKFRSAATSQEALQQVTIKDECYSDNRPVLSTLHSTIKYQPIIWKLASDRHYRLANYVSREDTPWHQKINMAIFRGQLTGSPEGYDKYSTDYDNCMRMRRCRLVYEHYNSSLVYAQLTSTRGRLPETLNSVPLVGPKLALRKLLQYKAIVMLEGNDVASGLKWALLSQSVVLMPIPKYTSWLMEEWLIPWLHYVPIDDDLSNVEERMQWVLDHDTEAQRIAERGSLWMQDLCFHPDARFDDTAIQEEMIRRYMAHFKAAKATTR